MMAHKNIRSEAEMRDLIFALNEECGNYDSSMMIFYLSELVSVTKSESKNGKHCVFITSHR